MSKRQGAAARRRRWVVLLLATGLVAVLVGVVLIASRTAFDGDDREERAEREEPAPDETAPSDAETEDVVVVPERVREPEEGLWLSQEEIAALPMRGPAWDGLMEWADKKLGKAKIRKQSSDHNVRTLAAALVWARTRDDSYRDQAAEGIEDAIGTEEGGRTLALGRQLPAYVIAADVIELGDYDPDLDEEFRVWLDEVRTEDLDGRTLVSTHEDRPNNWGTHAGAARIAASAYLGDEDDVAAAAAVFKGWLGDRSAYHGFTFGSDMSWHCDPQHPRGVNPQSCTKEGHEVGGVLPDDQRRCGSFQWPPCQTNYAWEALQGAVVQAELLHRQGYDAWEWEDQALRRAVEWLYEHDSPAEDDDTWQPWLVNRVYGTGFPSDTPSRPGKNLGWTDWTHPENGQPTSR